MPATTMRRLRLVPVLGYLAVAFAVLDFVSSIIRAPGCGRVAKLLWFIPDLRPLVSAWINSVTGVFSVVFTYAILAFIALAVISRLSGGRFTGHAVTGLLGTWLSKAFVVLLAVAILHSAVQALVAFLC